MSRVTDRLTFCGHGNEVSFIETETRRFDLTPPLFLKEGIIYRCEVFSDDRIMIWELILGEETNAATRH